MRHEDFLTTLRKAAARDTSADPEGWSPENPLWGHCAVAALLAQDYFGGELVRGSLEENEKYKHLRSHFWNKLSGEDVDFTAEQYPDLVCTDLPQELRERSRVLQHPDTKRRYTLLKERFIKEL